MSKVKDFKKDVMHEITMLREHATPEEKENLILALFDPTKRYSCIYGLLTGDCESERAKELMDKACIRTVHADTSEVINLSISNPDFRVNGEYQEQMWKHNWLGNRNYEYLSALEGYICTKGANIAGVMAYIKGETDEVKL